MNPLVFFIGCIGLRLLLTYVAKTSVNPVTQRSLSIITGVIALGFLTIYLFDLRKTGAEVGGKEIWWNNLRPIHGLLYGVFSVATYIQNPNAWMILLLDTIVGLFSYLSHYSYI
jgi:hypothetical protein